jgi:hypothetical protein
VPDDFDERRRTLQSAHEHVLAHDDRGHRTDALLTPLNAVLQLAQDLTKSGVTPEQQRLAVGICDQLASSPLQSKNSPRCQRASHEVTGD